MSCLFKRCGCGVLRFSHNIFSEVKHDIYSYLYNTSFMNHRFTIRLKLDGKYFFFVRNQNIC